MAISPVRQIKPRVGSIDSAFSAFLRADYYQTLSNLNGNTSIRASILRARVHLRLNRFADAIAELESLYLDCLSAADTAEVLGVLAFAKISSGVLEEAEHLITLARVRACEAGFVEIEAEVDFALAAFHYASGRPGEAEIAAERIVDATSEMPSWLAERPMTLTLPELKVRAYDFLGHLASNESRYVEKAQLIHRGLMLLEGSASHDHFIEAAVLSNLAFLSSELDLCGVHEFICSRLARMRFTEHTQKFEFEIHRSVGIGNAMHGDHVGALRSFRHSAEIAPNVPARIKAVTDRALLAKEIGETVCADEESDYALRLVKQHDWKNENGSVEIFALLSVSQNLATRDAIEARRIFSLYQTCKRNLPVFSYIHGDRGFVGREQQTDALISRHEGDAERAVRLNLEAFANFKSIGYAWRAAAVALELFELTDEPSYFAYAKTYAEKLPQSNLARRVERMVSARLALPV